MDFDGQNSDTNENPTTDTYFRASSENLLAMNRTSSLLLLAISIVGGLLLAFFFVQPEEIEQAKYLSVLPRTKIPGSTFEKGFIDNIEGGGDREISESELLQLICSNQELLVDLSKKIANGTADPVLTSLPNVCISNLPGLNPSEAYSKSIQLASYQEPMSAAPANGPSGLPARNSNAEKKTVATPTASSSTGTFDTNDFFTPDDTNQPMVGTPVNPRLSGNIMLGQSAQAWNPHANATQAVAPNTAACDEDPHANVYSRGAFPSAEECAVCHQQIFDEWSVSSHAYAAVSPMFHVFEQKINDLAQGTVGYFCLRCHAPVATTMGLRRDQPIWDGPKVFREGVTCVACHRVKTNYTKANGERRIEPGDINEPVYGAGDGIAVETAIKYKEFFKVLPDSTTGTGQAIHRRAIQFEELSESTFCASCHQVAVQPGIKLEVVWDQYRASPAWREGTTCQDCHMGKVPGMAEGYSVGPAAVVNDKVVNPERKHTNHMYYGPGYPITHPGIFPQSKSADRWHFNEWLLFDWQAGWGTEAFEKAVAVGQIHPYFPSIWSSADDRMDAREIVDKNIQKIAYKKDVRRQVLENGSQLDGPFFTCNPKLGAPLTLYYCLTNTNNGHNMPSGSLGAQPQIWMNVVLIGPNGERIWETGYLDTDGDLADIHSRDVLNRRVPLDKQLFNLQTKFLTTNVKGTDREMYLPVNLDIDQLPFLRPAPQPSTVINHPPFIRMEAHSLPPNAERKAKFVIPADCFQNPGTYRLSVRMRSRSHPVYFMRFCGATPEMMKAMTQEAADFHVQSSVFEIW